MSDYPNHINIENLVSNEIENSPNTGGVVQDGVIRNSRKHQ